MRRRASFFVPRRVARLLWTLWALCFALVTAPSHAHTVGVSRGEYRRVGAALELSLLFAESELAGDGARVLERVDVGGGCLRESASSAALERDGLRIDARFRCPEAAAVHVSLARLLGRLTRGHRHAATLLPSGTSVLVFESQPELVVPPGPAASAAPPSADAAPSPAAGGSFAGFVRLGVEHVLTGYDHLVFLLGLVVVGLGTRRALLVATAFTVSHSLSLAACVLGPWAPPSAIVEPAIALSIVYVGLENLLSESHERRAWLAFGFGLVHGLGFASALGDVRFRGLELARALFGFNAGVELGQLAVLALLLPLVAAVVGRPALARAVPRGISVAVAASGAAWLAARVLSYA